MDSRYQRALYQRTTPLRQSTFASDLAITPTTQSPFNEQQVSPTPTKSTYRNPQQQEPKSPTPARTQTRDGTSILRYRDQMHKQMERQKSVLPEENPAATLASSIHQVQAFKSTAAARPAAFYPEAHAAVVQPAVVHPAVPEPVDVWMDQYFNFDQLLQDQDARIKASSKQQNPAA